MEQCLDSIISEPSFLYGVYLRKLCVIKNQYRTLYNGHSLCVVTQSNFSLDQLRKIIFYVMMERC